MLTTSVVYGSKITSNDTAEDSPHYIGLTKNTFNHFLEYKTKKNSTEISIYVWDKKKDKQETSFKWYIKEKATACSPVTKRFMLYLSEKFHISFFKERLLTKQNKIISKCSHENKYKLSNYKIELYKGKCYIETNQLICCTKQQAGFYEIVTYGFNELIYF